MSLKRKFTFETEEAFWDAVFSDSWGAGRKSSRFKDYVVVEVAGQRSMFIPRKGWTPMKNGRVLGGKKGGL